MRLTATAVAVVAVIVGLTAYKVRAMESQIESLIERMQMTLRVEWRSGTDTVIVSATQEDDETPDEFRARFAEMVAGMKELFPSN